MKKKLHAIVLGATGATGQELVKQLLYNSNFSEISVFTRKTFSIAHEKLNKNKIDFSKWDNYKSLVIGDVFFSRFAFASLRVAKRLGLSLRWKRTWFTWSSKASRRRRSRCGFAIVAWPRARLPRPLGSAPLKSPFNRINSLHGLAKCRGRSRRSFPAWPTP